MDEWHSLNLLQLKFPSYNVASVSAEVDLSRIEIKCHVRHMSKSLVELVFRLQLKTVLKDIEVLFCDHNEHEVRAACGRVFVHKNSFY